MTTVLRERERRDYSRCLVDARAELRIGDRVVTCEARDVSLQGALVCVPGGRVPASDGDACTVAIHLDAGPAVIVMQGAVAHAGDGKIGVTCREMDLDSFAHVLRLLQLNLGEEKLVRSELATLTARRRR